MDARDEKKRDLTPQEAVLRKRLGELRKAWEKRASELMGKKLSLHYTDSDCAYLSTEARTLRKCADLISLASSMRVGSAFDVAMAGVKNKVGQWADY